jgi:hypothetical protein
LVFLNLIPRGKGFVATMLSYPEILGTAMKPTGKRFLLDEPEYSKMPSAAPSGINIEVLFNLVAIASSAVISENNSDDSDKEDDSHNLRTTTNTSAQAAGNLHTPIETGVAARGRGEHTMLLGWRYSESGYEYTKLEEYEYRQAPHLQR